MIKEYHILNGDALKVRFPRPLKGSVIVMRECLVDGDVQGETLSDLYQTRTDFFASHYKGYSEGDYFNKSISEFSKIQGIPKECEINMWFEWDLFCQVNFWFVMHLLDKHYLYRNTHALFFVQPKQGSEYSFAHMTDDELISAHRDKLRIEYSEADKFSQLWHAYQINDDQAMLRIGRDLEPKYPHVSRAIQAHIDRRSVDGNPGRIERSLIRIMEDLKTQEFGPVFKAFCKREGIYGLGDAQVRRILSAILGSGA